MPTPRDAFEAALEQLAEADRPSALAKAHRALLDGVRQQRRHAKQTLGPLAATLTAAQAIWDQQTAEGVSIADRAASMEQSVRAVWPTSREEPWHYGCDVCGDTGFRVWRCRPGHRCNGHSTMFGHKRLCTRDATYEHDLAEFCDCAKGYRMREVQRGPKPEDISHAGKVKQKDFGRFGRHT